MHKDKKQKKEVPLNIFLQSGEYFNLKQELNKALNYNSQMVNSEVPHFTNLITSRIDSFRKSDDEKLALKAAKKDYKDYLNTLHGNNLRRDVVSAFIQNVQLGFPRNWMPQLSTLD